MRYPCVLQDFKTYALKARQDSYGEAGAGAGATAIVCEHVRPVPASWHEVGLYRQQKVIGHEFGPSI